MADLIIPNWHPIFVHFTVGLLAISSVLFVLSKLLTDWRREDQILTTAYWNLWLGTAITLGTVTAGYIAFNSVEHDTPSHLEMITHRNFAFGTLAVFIVLSVWGWWESRAERPPSIVFVLAMLVGLGALGATAWRGGELVYRHGLGVMALPDKNEHAHAEGEAHSQDEPAESPAGASGAAGEEGHGDQPETDAATPHTHDDSGAAEETTGAPDHGAEGAPAGTAEEAASRPDKE